MIVPVILSGGSGTRLWPLSTAHKPKQFLALIGEDSLFRQTLDRVGDRRRYAPPVIVSNSAHVDLCRVELADCDGARLILEPCARNTAAAIVMAAEAVRAKHGPDALILVLPSDHRIGKPDQFDAAVDVAATAADTGRLVTFGVVPRGPETGYGYLKAGVALAEAPDAFEVEKFVEKPQLAAAEEMVRSGRHYWNGGIFLFRVSDFLSQAAVHAPDISDCALRAIGQARHDGICIFPEGRALENCPNISVDYAVMERSSSIAMARLDADWSDVGSWDALAELDSVESRQVSVTSVESENCYVRTDRLKVGLLGVRDLVVVASGDQLLIMRKGHSQHIRELAAQAMAEG